jgi:beta-lactamase regulating signal transducer with metallopeptidase domain
MNLESHFTILLELLIKSAALTLVGLALLASIRKSSAANRHAVVALLFGALFLLPLTMLVPPLWSFGLESAKPEPVATVLLPPATPVTKTVELAVAPALESADPVASHAPAPHESPAIPWQALAFAVWLAGVAILLARRAVIAVLLQSVLRQSRALKNERLARLVRETVEAGGRDAEVRVSTRCRVPLVAGIVRPVILLPVEAEGWSDALVSSALRHELGHIRRRDCAVRLLADIACCGSRRSRRATTWC